MGGCQFGERCLDSATETTGHQDNIQELDGAQFSAELARR